MKHGNWNLPVWWIPAAEWLGNSGFVLRVLSQECERRVIKRHWKRNEAQSRRHTFQKRALVIWRVIRSFKQLYVCNNYVAVSLTSISRSFDRSWSLIIVLGQKPTSTCYLPDGYVSFILEMWTWIRFNNLL